MDEFIAAVKEKLDGVMDKLGWDLETLKTHHATSTCQYDSKHRVPTQNLVKHELMCNLLRQGITRKDAESVHDTSFAYANSPLVSSFSFTDREKQNILMSRCVGDRYLVGGVDVHRLLTREERLALYEFLIEKVKFDKKMHKIPDEQLMFLEDETEENAKKQGLTLAELRDMKRRRPTYRAKNVHVTKKSYTMVMRDVLENQFKILEYNLTMAEQIKAERAQSKPRDARDLIEDRRSSARDIRSSSVRSSTRSEVRGSHPRDLEVSKMYSDGRSMSVMSRESRRDSREFDRQSTSREFGRQSSSRDFERHSRPRDFERQSSSREFDRQSSSRDFERQSSSREIGRQSSSRDFERQSSSRDLERHSSSREFDRQSSSRDFSRQSSSRDIERQSSRTRGSQRQSSSREFDREISDLSAHHDPYHTERRTRDRSAHEDHRHSRSRSRLCSQVEIPGDRRARSSSRRSKSRHSGERSSSKKKSSKKSRKRKRSPSGEESASESRKRKHKHKKDKKKKKKKKRKKAEETVASPENSEDSEEEEEEEEEDIEGEEEEEASVDESENESDNEDLESDEELSEPSLSPSD